MEQEKFFGRRGAAAYVNDERGRALPGAPVNAVARLTHDPCTQLLIGMRYAMEITQRDEVVLDIFDPRFHPSLFSRIFHGTRVNQE